MRLLEGIRSDIDRHVFDPSEYLPREVARHRLSAMWERYALEREAAGVTAARVRKIRQVGRMYVLPSVGDIDCREIRAMHVSDVTLAIKDLEASSRVSVLSVLKAFLRWLVGMEVLHKMPPVSKPVIPEKPIKWISKAEQLRILSHIPARHHPVFSFLLSHPVRPSEARALRRSDFDLQRRVVQIARSRSEGEERTRKGNHIYYLPIATAWDTSVLADLLPAAHVFTLDGHPYSDRSLGKIWARACRKAGIEIKLYNATRHSIASQARHDGVPLDRISSALGHTTTEQTRRYAALDIEALRDVIER